MPTESSPQVSEYIVMPLMGRILIRKDEERTTTRGGIVLPENSKIPTITGRIVEISPDLENDDEFPVQKYDRVIVNPNNSIPVDFESDNKLFIIPVSDVVAVFKKNDGAA